VEHRKLAQLRAKTNWDLGHVISKEIHRGLVYANVVNSRDCSIYEKAERIHAEAVTLLAMAYGLSDVERAAVEAELDELRLVLDRVPPRGVQPMTAGM
jgi:hypothetical protein